MDDGFHHYIGAGRTQPVLRYRDLTVDGIRTDPRYAAGRAMFEWLPCGDEDGNGRSMPDPQTTDRRRT
jgi:hypothetical protein